MPVTNDDILAALTKITLPGGGDLASSGRLSEIVNSDGKVIFAIAVDASEVNAMESVRAAAEMAVRQIPGVSTALVGLTGERPAGAARPARPPAQDRHPGETPLRRGPPPPQGGAPGQGRMPQQAGIPGVSHIVAVASGKGGVG
ncbi:MAG: DUF59 domain-containing protein, partial [Hyphomicrobiales bacterium]|nr:DUF59 domain-containing protein [Hyphomicrobiales bacterium]